MLVRIRNELGASDMNIIVTGGVGKIILPHIQNVTDYNPDLTLHGLHLIFDQLHG
jgi:type III pantothenate kinase